MEAAKYAPLASALDTDSVLIVRAGVGPFRISRAVLTGRQVGGWKLDENFGQLITNTAAAGQIIATLDTSVFTNLSATFDVDVFVRDVGTDQGSGRWVVSSRSTNLGTPTVLGGNMIGVGTITFDISGGFFRVLVQPVDTVVYTWNALIRARHFG